MDKYRVALDAEERAALEQLVSTGKSASRRLTHARVLLLADAHQGGGHSDDDILTALGVSSKTISRVRKRFVTEGIGAAIDHIELQQGELKPVRIAVEMLNSAGVFQLDALLKEKLTGSRLEPYVEVIATIKGETEKKLVALALADGKLAWETPFAVQGRGYNAATPIVDGQTIIYTGSGRGATASSSRPVTAAPSGSTR